MITIDFRFFFSPSETLSGRFKGTHRCRRPSLELISQIQDKLFFLLTMKMKGLCVLTNSVVGAANGISIHYTAFKSKKSMYWYTVSSILTGYKCKIGWIGKKQFVIYYVFFIMYTLFHSKFIDSGTVACLI